MVWSSSIGNGETDDVCPQFDRIYIYSDTNGYEYEVNIG